MRGRGAFETFVAARTQDLHHDAYLLTADQDNAEQLVSFVLAELSREHIDLSRAASTARSRMARTAVRAERMLIDNPANVAARFRTLASLAPRQRAVLMLEVLDGHDRHSAARALGLKSRDVEQAYAAIPPGLTDTGPAELRSLLDDFGDLVETPSPEITLAAIRGVHPRHRPRWTYAAAALVIALTVSTLWITQTWQDNWLRTAAGLNHTHGTHFPAYADGYKLVGIRDVSTGGREDLALGERTALAVPCAGLPNGSAMGQVVTGDNGNYPARCSAKGHADLMPTTGDTLLTINGSNGELRPVAIYQKVPWSEYPVATSGFSVQTGRTLHIDDQIDPFAPPKSRSKRGPVLTLRSTPDHLNGTFTGSVVVPAGSREDAVAVGGLLSPTTTGRFQVALDGQPWFLNCDLRGRSPYDLVQRNPWCEIYDQHVPQVPFGGAPFGAVGKTLHVRITVEHALGPWTLQVAADRYRPEFGG